jgi:hypothetical protein
MCPIFRQNVPVRGLFVSALVWLLGCALAEAQAEVVLFERAPLRPGLCAALRIQLSGSAEVRCVADVADGSLAERLNAARRSLRDGGDLIGVLLERDSDPRLMRMYLVTGEGEQAALAIERIEDRPEPDVDRSLALKVRDAYEVIAFVERTMPQQDASAAVLAKPGPKSAEAPAGQGVQPAPAPQAPHWLSFVEIGGGLSLGDSVRAVGSALLGVGRATARRRYELGLGARMLQRQHESSSLGQISVVDFGPMLTLRALARRKRLELGAFAELFVAVSAAEGFTTDGESGEKRVATLVLGLGPDLRVRMFRSAYLRFAPSFELWTTNQRFALDHQVVIERGYVSASLPLSLLISLPLQKTPEDFQP